MDLQKTAESLLEGKPARLSRWTRETGAVLAFACSPTFDQEKFIRGLKKEEWLALSKDPHIRC